MINQYLAWKAGLTVDTGLSESLLHLHAGLAIFVVTALLLKKRMRSPIPLAVVVTLAILNEVVDFLYGTKWSAAPSALDLVNTILWPAILFLLARRRGPSR